MKLMKYVENPRKALDYSERYINDGSPSGFTALYRSSPETDPYGDNSYFHLFALHDDNKNFQLFTSQDNVIDPYPDLFFIHPDMINHPDLMDYNIEKVEKFKVVPTASSRTVRILDGLCHDYIKLYYDGIVGRTNRKLYTIKAISGPEISSIFVNALKNRVFVTEFAIFNEKFAKIHKNINISNDLNYWGYIWRDSTPFGNSSKKIDYIIPFFSLWSTDRRNPSEKLLFIQLIEKWQKDWKLNVYEKMLYRLLDIYFESVLKLGLLFEFNAQNVLLGLDENFDVASIILRDMMDTEKDYSMREQKGLDNRFVSYPYHVISEEDKDFWQKRHSFSFDFKLSLYVIEPLVDMCSRLGLVLKTNLIHDLKIYTEKWLKHLPIDFFPRDRKWFSYEKVLIDKEKILVPNDNPLLR